MLLMLIVTDGLITITTIIIEGGASAPDDMMGALATINTIIMESVARSWWCEYEVRTVEACRDQSLMTSRRRGYGQQWWQWYYWWYVWYSYCLLDCYYFFIITYREIAISGVVPKCKSDNTTPDRAWSIERRSLFEAESGCNGRGRRWGSQPATFQLYWGSRRGVMYNKLTSVCLKGPPLHVPPIGIVPIWYCQVVLVMLLDRTRQNWFEWGVTSLPLTTMWMYTQQLYFL